MKGKTILGVALTLMLLSSLLFSAAPVSAGTLSWSDETIPTTDDEVLQPGTDVLDTAVAEDGMTIYAAGSGIVKTVTLNKQGNNDATWSTEQKRGSSSAKLVYTGSSADMAYLEFTPPTGITLAEFVAAITTYGFYYFKDTSGGCGPEMELKFTDGDKGWVRVTVEAALYDYLLEGDPNRPETLPDAPLPTDEWSELTFSDAEQGQFFGDNPAGASLTFTANFDISELITKINDDVKMSGDTLGYECDAWEMDLVTVSLGWIVGEAQTGYIDDIMIAGTTYNLEGVDGSSDDGTASIGTVYRSTDAGESWSALGNPTGAAAPQLVAVAPDDENYIAIVADGTEVYVSDDAGATWDELNTDLTIDVINDMALSVEKSGNHFCAVAGVDGAAAAVWNYEIGAVGAVWEEISSDVEGFPGFAAEQDVAGAVAFSPNFASDETLTAVTANFSTGGAIYFQVFSFNQDEWNIFSDYPVEIVGETADAKVDKLDSASISLAPDYLGSDDALRMAFVGITTLGTATADEADGIFRLDDDDVDTVKDEKNIHSVAYDGTNLVAGRYDDVTVYRCDDPLASSPSVSGSASLKSPGGEEKVVVAWAGDEVVAGTTGDESAFAVSRNDGKCFNDISLIDTTLTNLRDVAVSADGSNVYLVTDDGDSDLSLWRYASAWERVLTVQATSNYIVRTAPEDMDVVYVAEMGGSAIYYSTDAGEARWHTRTSRYTISDDVAVETDGGVVYVATSSGYVSKSSNSGFTWASKKSSKLSAGISMFISLGEDVLLAGSADGKAAYSTDGGLNWTKLADGMTSGNVQVIGSGVTTADSIYAAVDTIGDYIYRWDWADEEWDEITEDGDIPADSGVFGLALQEGILYAAAANATDNSTCFRSLNPTADAPDWDTMDSVGESFDVTPSALRVSHSEGITKLWAIDTISGANDLFSYKDTLAVTAPALVSPTHGSSIKVNPVTGYAFDQTFVWEKPSDKVTGYDLQIALDEDFDQVALSLPVISDDDIVSVVVGPTGSVVMLDDTIISYTLNFMADTTYYWRVRVDAATIDTTDYGPIRSPWSIVYTLSVEEAAAAVTEVIVEPAPAPEVTVTAPPAPEVTVTVPPAPAPITPAPAIPAYLLWTIIIIGAVLIIALIVLIVRTRRVV